MGGCMGACGFGIHFGEGEAARAQQKKGAIACALKNPPELRSLGADECVRPYVSIASLLLHP
jgi:hypothetical protein